MPSPFTAFEGEARTQFHLLSLLDSARLREEKIWVVLFTIAHMDSAECFPTFSYSCSLVQVEKRRKEALSQTGEDGASTLESSLQDVVSRYSFMDLWPCTSSDLDNLTRQEVITVSFFVVCTWFSVDALNNFCFVFVVCFAITLLIYTSNEVNSQALVCTLMRELGCLEEKAWTFLLYFYFLLEIHFLMPLLTWLQICMPKP